MGSHKHKKQNEPESSASDGESSSSEDDKKKKMKRSKKSKHSDIQENYNKYNEGKDKRDYNKVSKSRRRQQSRSVSNSEASDYEEMKTRKHKTRDSSYDRHTEKHQTRHKEATHSANKTDDRYKSYEKERSRSREREFRRDRRDDRYRDRDSSRNEHRRDENNSYRDKSRHQSRGRYYDRRRRSSSIDHSNAKWGKPEDSGKSDKKEQTQKDKPNFSLSGKLTEETNTYRGVVIKYSEPPEARKPRRRWRLYPFKGEKALQTLYIHRESAYLIGRDRKVVDLPVDHPSCSKQHAALQYRLVPFTREDGTGGKRVRPYLIDLDSANGTFINNKRIDSRKYVELLERDVIKFGYSSREYVLLHENSKDEAMDDDVKQEEEELAKVKKER